ncbi:zinc metalloprotease HtpX [Candidatus Pacearchaeota archaeon CG_4_9_14_3_um_filter_30_11]|nr:MAG: zinc metalloprotease HtpX [Candidatus Pacearchaeota archaeon CG11_big_fil_rev_8_21_14_0_20_30_13]PIZ81780.1 MAG: zinc metalloprotease HtpX [Candidatus Pacearchaeota archaeon CG_4_10_14_0_2_um_filter_30_11]PJA71270.1 MAG: zinc metalloprotease HtpX [Candidatus Pacearchaeota archaeon CG_4_9_14_3_um_filter_30_11]
MEHIDFRDQISRNKRNSIFLMVFVILVIVLLGWTISNAFDPSYFFLIMIVSIIFSIFYVWINFYNSDKIAIKSVGAKLADRIKYRDYYRLVESLTVASSLPMPKLYIMESHSINAFASGRDPNHAVLCVTTGSLEKLERRELEGVLAHEMGHVANYDIRFITLVAVMVGMIAIISQIFLRSLWFRGGGDNKNSGIFIVIGILLAILAPIVVSLVQLSISRKREFTADATAVKFTRNPTGLIGALEKIRKENTPNEKVSKAIAPLFFSNPFKRLSSTHPPIEKRIEALKSF